MLVHKDGNSLEVIFLSISQNDIVGNITMTNDIFIEIDIHV